MLGEKSSTVTFADIETSKRERRTGAGTVDKSLPIFHESDENESHDNVDIECEFSGARKSDSLELSPMLSDPILIPGDSHSLSPAESQKNLSRSFEESRPRSLETETEKDSTTSKGFSNFHYTIFKDRFRALISSD